MATLINHQFTIPFIPVTPKLYTQSGRGLRNSYVLQEIPEEDIAKKAGLESLLEYLVNRSEKRIKTVLFF